MTVLDALQSTADQFERAGFPTPRLEAELLIEHLLHIPRLELYLEREARVPSSEQQALARIVARRLSHEPLQYIVGHTEFHGLRFDVGPGVLIPRPETEGVIDEALDWLRGQPEDLNCRALDIGTGSGCLAITMVIGRANLHVTAMEPFEPALSFARQNAKNHGVTDRIEFQPVDQISNLPPGRRFELVVSNPPYIPIAEIPTLQPEIRDHEPHTALDGGPDGLEFYRMLARELPAIMPPDGRFIGEFGDGQADAIRALFQSAGWTQIGIRHDLSRIPRIIIAHTPKPGA